MARGGKIQGTRLRRFRDVIVKEECKGDYPHSHSSGFVESVGSGGGSNSELSNLRTTQTNGFKVELF
jgi:hypothetical protein